MIKLQIAFKVHRGPGGLTSLIGTETLRGEMSNMVYATALQQVFYPFFFSRVSTAFSEIIKKIKEQL